MTTVTGAPVRVNSCLTSDTKGAIQKNHENILRDIESFVEGELLKVSPERDQVQSQRIVRLQGCKYPMLVLTNLRLCCTIPKLLICKLKSSLRGDVCFYDIVNRHDIVKGAHWLRQPASQNRLQCPCQEARWHQLHRLLIVRRIVSSLKCSCASPPEYRVQAGVVQLILSRPTTDTASASGSWAACAAGCGSLRSLEALVRSLPPRLPLVAPPSWVLPLLGALPCYQH